MEHHQKSKAVQLGQVERLRRSREWLRVFTRTGSNVPKRHSMDILKTPGVLDRRLHVHCFIFAAVYKNFLTLSGDAHSVRVTTPRSSDCYWKIELRISKTCADPREERTFTSVLKLESTSQTGQFPSWWPKNTRRSLLQINKSGPA